MTAPVLNHSIGYSAVPRVDHQDVEQAQRQDGFYRRYGKRLFDLTLLVLSVPIVLPVILIVTTLLLLQGGNPFYTQPRLGYQGRPYRILKFRSMYPDADKVLEGLLERDPALRAEWDTKQKLCADPRVTRLGHMLRRSSIDELPQLWNVLVGDMSLLGPRPMMLDQQHLYGPALPVYTALRPGISGVWQVSERNESHFQRRAELDIEYARTLSFRTDVELVWKTLRTIVRRTGC